MVGIVVVAVPGFVVNFINFITLLSFVLEPNRTLLFFWIQFRLARPHGWPEDGLKLRSIHYECFCLCFFTLALILPPPPPPLSIHHFFFPLRNSWSLLQCHLKIFFPVFTYVLPLPPFFFPPLTQSCL